jgi:hypothetical protein
MTTACIGKAAACSYAVTLLIPVTGSYFLHNLNEPCPQPTRNRAASAEASATFLSFTANSVL